MEQSLFAKHGGVHFQQMASASEINSFVNRLPERDRENLFEVLQKLDQAGLIKLKNDEVWTDGAGQVGGEDVAGFFP